MSALWSSLTPIAVEPRPVSYLFLILLFVGLPWLSARTHNSGQVLTMPRPAIYLSVTITQWLVVPLLLLTLWLEGYGAASLGLVYGAGEDPGMALTTIRSIGDLARWGGGVVVLAFAVSGVLWLVRRSLGRQESATIRHLIPRTTRERVLFCLVVSTTAGFVEELLYRGFAVSRLAGLIGEHPAAITAAAAFSLGHVYQGSLGVARAGLIGYVLTIPYLVTGSLWPSILAHIAIDMLSGGLLGSMFLEAGDEAPSPPVAEAG